MKWIFPLSMLVMLLVSCNETPSVETVVTTEQKPSTIKLFAQASPGGQPFDFDMPIDQGLDKLTITSPESTEIAEDELVLGFISNEEALAIPIKYMSGFEVANLAVDSTTYLLTWCPLVGSARIFEGAIDDDRSGFDFGRGLIDDNLLIVDRKTNTVWNQLSCRAIEGALKGQRLSPEPSIQSTWAFWNNKYPNTKVVVNTDTSNAVFPEFVLQKPHYTTWIPGEKFPAEEGHNIDRLGLGVEQGESAVFFAFEQLFKAESPFEYLLEGDPIYVHFDKEGMTAWAENRAGTILPGTIVYDWAWERFFPNSLTLE